MANEMRAWTSLLIVILAISRQFIEANAVSLTIRPQGPIREGETINVVCETKGRGHFDIIQLVKQINNTSYTITTNNFVENRFSRTGRYSITKWNDSGLVELQISHIRGVDGGNIGCEHRGSNKKFYTDVIVNVPVSSVELRYQSTDGRWYSPINNDRVLVAGNVSCNVTVIGSNFKPEVIITLGGEKVTSQFRKKHFETEEKDVGFVNLVYSAVYDVNLHEIESARAGKNLTCWAKTEQHEPKSASIIIDITQKPNLKCLNFWYGVFGATNFTLTCYGKMDPGPDKVVWTARKREVARSSGTITHIQYPTLTDRYSSRVSTLESGGWEFNLTIFQIRKEDFTEYVLEVSNAIGSLTYAIQLVEANLTAQNMIVQRSQILEISNPPPTISSIRDSSNIISHTHLPLLTFGAISFAVVLVNN